MGQIFTFYSYKGRVGRSMALANVAVLLAKWDYNVLIVDVAIKAHENRKKLPFDRQMLISLPVLSKFDSSEEFKISQWWLDQSASELESLYANWLPRSINIRDFLTKTKIPPKLSPLKAVDLYEKGGFEKLQKAIHTAVASQTAPIKNIT